MNIQDTRLETKEKVEEISKKVEELKENMRLQTRGEVKQQASAIIDNLESLKNKVEEEYSQLARNSEQGRDAGEIEKNIFTSIDAFNNAFTKAGSIFKG